MAYQRKITSNVPSNQITVARKEMKLRVVDKLCRGPLRGLDDHHPRRLVNGVLRDYYISTEGSPNEDFIVLEVVEKSPFLPGAVVIENNAYSNTAVKVIEILGGNGKSFEKWITIENIKNTVWNPQRFPIDEKVRAKAMDKNGNFKYKYLKIKIVQNYGMECNSFSQFAIIDERGLLSVFFESTKTVRRCHEPHILKSQ